jgi:hypothetical protein
MILAKNLPAMSDYIEHCQNLMVGEMLCPKLTYDAHFGGLNFQLEFKNTFI